MPVLKIKNNGVWEQVSGIPDHTHVIDDITDFPTSLPANGGNADTVDGKHASDFASAAEMTTVQNDINDINTMLNGIKAITNDRPAPRHKRGRSGGLYAHRLGHDRLCRPRGNARPFLYAPGPWVKQRASRSI